MNKEKKSKKPKKERKPRAKKDPADKAKRGKGFSLRRKKAAAAEGIHETATFGAALAPSEPILTMKDVKPQPAWKKDLTLNIACAVMMTTVVALFCMSLDVPELLPFALTCPVVFMLVASLSYMKPRMVKWIAAGAVGVVLMLTAVIWHSALFEGGALLLNLFYDVAEEAQAYVYDRVEAAEASEGAIRGAIAWVSALLGLIAALPPAKYRRLVSGLIAVAIMAAFAYYGIMPSAVCIAVMIAALFAALSRGGLLSFVPLTLIALLLFGAIVFVDPGESYTVSRLNENIRDRIALRSALIQSEESYYDETYEETQDESYTEDSEESEEEEDTEYGTYAVIGLIAAAVLAIGTAVFLFFRRLAKKRALNRKGINSEDPREAITAMFPYSVKWLKGFGIEQSDASFSSMEPELKQTFSDIYAGRFMEMYDVWNEAAYSDHEVQGNSRILMEAFMKDTMTEVNKKCKFKDKLRLKLKYGL